MMLPRRNMMIWWPSRVTSLRTWPKICLRIPHQEYGCFNHLQSMAVCGFNHLQSMAVCGSCTDSSSGSIHERMTPSHTPQQSRDGINEVQFASSSEDEDEDDMCFSCSFSSFIRFVFKYFIRQVCEEVIIF